MWVAAWWMGCGPALPLEAELAPSRWVPAAAEVRWTGPSGEASLWVAGSPFGAWRQVAASTVEDGASSLPLTLLPVGRTWRWRVEVEAGDELWRSDTETVAFEAPEQVSMDRKSSDAGAAFPGGWWVGNQYGPPFEPDGAVAVVLDGDGSVVWWAPSPDGYRVIRAHPSRDGRDVIVLEDHEDPEKRRIVRYSLDGTRRTVTAAPQANHELRENDDGTFSYLAYVFSDEELVPRTPGPTASDAIRTVPEGSPDGADATDGFDFFDDYPADPWFACGHVGWDQFVPGAAEWTHANSLIRSPLGDGWLVVVRHLDAVVQAGDEGQFGWQVGGREATIAPIGPVSFEHAHATDAWAEGDAIHLLLFDNGDHSPEPILSRVVELRIDPAAGTVQEVWSLPDPRERRTTFLGDAQRLPGGNTLVTWTGGLAGPGRLAEYTPAGEEIWRLDSDAPLARGTWVPTLTP
jgi:hypothetical protein